MKINKVSMAIIAATAVLAVSPAVLAQTTNQAAGGAGAAAGGAGRMGGRTNMMTVESLDKAVTLTDAEKPKVKSALEDYTKALTEARQADQSERRTKMTAARTDLDKKLKEVLTPEQYTKYQAMPGRGGRNGGRNRGGAGGAGGGAGGAGGGGGGQ
jgi:Spy/CpxP family protein refolding chaperone